MAACRGLACCRELPQSLGAHGAPYVQASHARFPGMPSTRRVRRAHQLCVSPGVQATVCEGRP